MEAKRIDYNVQSTVQPESIVMNDYEVLIRTNITTTQVPNGMDDESNETTTMYVYTEAAYDKNEYLTAVMDTTNLPVFADRSTMSDSELITYLKALFNSACDQALSLGITVNVPELGEKNFSCKLEDQFNIEAIVKGITADTTQVYYHSNGDKCRLYDIATFAEITGKVFVYKYQQTSYCNLIKSYIETCSREDKIATQYGDTPSAEFAEELNQIIIQGITSTATGFVTANETFNKVITQMINSLLPSSEE